jgi:hypothetical protein
VTSLTAVATTAVATAPAASSTISVALAAIAVTTVTVSGSSATIAISVAVTVGWWALLVRVVIRFYLLEELFTKLLRLSYTFRTRSSDVEIHGLVALLAAVWFHETRTATLDLDLAACLLLDEFDVIATATDNLCAQVKAANGLETYRDLLFGPLASTKLIALKVLGLPTTEATFVYQVRKVFFHHLLDHFYSLVQAFFGGASNTEVQRRVSSSCHVLVRVVFSASGYILHV